MEITAASKYVRISPSKVYAFARLFKKGMPVSDALNLTRFSKKKAACLIEKTLKSAIANTENNAKASADEFRIKSVIVEKGPSMKRYWHRARGMVRPIIRRMCHIKVTLVND